MRWLFVLLGLVACERPASVPEAPRPEASTTEHADACRDDIPDCAAACALRETKRLEFIDFYERRCATVILGKNPDKVPPPPFAETMTTTAPDAQGTGQGAQVPLTTRHAPFDPTSVSRMGGSEPAECRAARLLRAQKREHEADMLEALCVVKGGPEGFDAGVF
jgi:hypothetical protein